MKHKPDECQYGSAPTQSVGTSPGSTHLDVVPAGVTESAMCSPCLEDRVGISKHRYEELAKEAYSAMTAAIMDLGWHEMNYKACKTPLS
jgi:hypothetical protein